jgi:hypothetical protein
LRRRAAPARHERQVGHTKTIRIILPKRHFGHIESAQILANMTPPNLVSFGELCSEVEKLQSKREKCSGARQIGMMVA